MRMKWVVIGLAVTTLMGCGTRRTDPVIVTSYEVDDDLFPNPERGLYRYTSLHSLDPEIGALRDSVQMTLVWGRIMMRDYREQETLPDTFLQDVERGFQIAREQGMKVIVRGSYGSRGPGGDYTTYTDPSEKFMRNHIAQLAPIFAAHADVIALFEAGFIGPWGEFHTTELANDMRRSGEFIHLLLDQTPADRMVLVRYPLLKQKIFETESGAFEQVSATNAYSGDPVARVGHHNDCFLSSETDVGTYDRGGMDRAGEVAYLANETLHTVFGGETCADYERNDCGPALEELALLHTSYLNSGWHPDVFAKWERDGCLNEILMRLGARLVLKESRVSESTRAGESLSATLDLENVGFASLYNARNVEIVLRDSSGNSTSIMTGIDPRDWKPGRQEVKLQVQVPSGLPPGEYTVHLHLADPSPRLHDDARFAFRVASAGVWDAATGWNRLAEGIQIEAP